jgi:hypothetical protein
MATGSARCFEGRASRQTMSYVTARRLGRVRKWGCAGCLNIPFPTPPAARLQSASSKGNGKEPRLGFAQASGFLFNSGSDQLAFHARPVNINPQCCGHPVTLGQAPLVFPRGALARAGAGPHKFGCRFLYKRLLYVPRNENLVLVTTLPFKPFGVSAAEPLAN